MSFYNVHMFNINVQFIHYFFPSLFVMTNVCWISTSGKLQNYSPLQPRNAFLFLFIFSILTFLATTGKSETLSYMLTKLPAKSQVREEKGERKADFVKEKGKEKKVASDTSKHPFTP